MTKAASRPVLAVDFDDTIVLNAHNLIDTYNQEIGGSVKLENIYLPGKLGNPDAGWKHDLEGAMDWIRAYLARPETLDRPPIEGAKEALGNLSNKYHIAVLTGRDKSIDHLVHGWLEEHLDGVVQAIYHAGATQKSVICKRIGANVIIDDSPAYIHDCHQAGIEVVVFGDYPWNQADRLPEEAPIAKNWAEVERILI